MMSSSTSWMHPCKAIVQHEPLLFQEMHFPFAAQHTISAWYHAVLVCSKPMDLGIADSRGDLCVVILEKRDVRVRVLAALVYQYRRIFFEGRSEKFRQDICCSSWRFEVQIPCWGHRCGHSWDQCAAPAVGLLIW